MRASASGDFVLDVGLALDVDPAADELGGEAHVLAALADGERELLVLDDDVEVRLRHRRGAPRRG